MPPEERRFGSAASGGCVRGTCRQPSGVVVVVGSAAGLALMAAAAQRTGAPESWNARGGGEMPGTRTQPAVYGGEASQEQLGGRNDATWPLAS